MMVKTGIVGGSAESSSLHRLVRSIRRESWLGGRTVGKTLRLWRVEIGIGLVIGWHSWLRWKTGRTQENHGRKWELQIYRIVFGAVWRDASNGELSCREPKS